jgi:hypothetical protein
MRREDIGKQEFSAIKRTEMFLKYMPNLRNKN